MNRRLIRSVKHFRCLLNSRRKNAWNRNYPSFPYFCFRNKMRKSCFCWKNESGCLRLSGSRN